MCRMMLVFTHFWLCQVPRKWMICRWSIFSSHFCCNILRLQSYLCFWGMFVTPMAVVPAWSQVKMWCRLPGGHIYMLKLARHDLLINSVDSNQAYQVSPVCDAVLKMLPSNIIGHHPAHLARKVYYLTVHAIQTLWKNIKDEMKNELSHHHPGLQPK